MRIAYYEYGGPEVLQIEDETVPEPGVDELIVRNEVIGVNPIDWKMIAGVFRHQEPHPSPGVPGWASVGTVEQVGAAVQHFQPGQKVIIGSRAGSYRERQVVNSRYVVALPPGLAIDQAAGLPSSAVAGYSIIHQLGIAADDVLLIHGAAGSVGSAAAQIAIAEGATVIGSASTKNHEFLRSLGVTPVEYGPNLLADVRNIADPTAVADAVGGQGPAEATSALLGSHPRSVTAWGTRYSQAAGIPGLRHPDDELERVVKYALDGALTVRIADDYVFEDVKRALEASMTMHASGKILLRL
ncbi:NADP-dependent oxidoreductase [Microbacterium foliorum]|nr:NADP-dependent oxidoreductase [Microbacterium foliorum]AXL12575.1 NADP-dependent oxidoreductase [Microbacterium foliorum]